MIFLALGGLGWVYSYTYSGFGILTLTIILVFIFNDFKYFIPAGLLTIFSYNIGYESSKFPVEIALYGGALIFMILLYSIFNFKLSSLGKPKSYIGVLLLAISCIIPIFWNEVITKETGMMYWLYFTWVLYIVVYFIFGINLGRNSLRVTIFTLSSLTALISFECTYSIIQIHNDYPNSNILNSWYYLGWGLCNEAGIMICFGLPFVFYELVKSENPIISAIGVLKLVIAVVGIIFTTSRGAILFGAIEIGILTILMIIFSKKKITNIFFLLLVLGLAILYIELKFGLVKFMTDLKDTVFTLGMNDNGRKELWNSAYNLWNKNWLTRIFGSGMVSELREQASYNGTDTVFIVYHSTFFQTLCFGGGFGVLALLFHFFEKYKQLWKKEISFGLIMLFGYLVVDGYGMIDNTYGMYYYMIPLVVFMASLDNDKNTDIFKNVELSFC